MSNAKKIAGSLLGDKLTEEECEVLSTIVKNRKLQAGEVLFDVDSEDDTLYILTTGQLEVLKVMPGNNTLSMDVLEKGTMTGESAFLNGQAHSMRLVAKKESEVLTLHRDDFESLIETNPRLVYNVMRAILRHSHTLQRKINRQFVEMHRMVQNQYSALY